MQLSDQSIEALCTGRNARLPYVRPSYGESRWLRCDQPLIEPFDYACLGPATYDVHLAPTLLFSHAKGGKIDLRVPREYEEHFVEMLAEGYDLYPYEHVKIGPPSRQDLDLMAKDPFYVPFGVRRRCGRAKGATIERFCVPPWLQMRFDGRSSLGRDFLITHVTAGIVDAGFGWDEQGSAGATLTVELLNMSEDIWVLYPGMPIGQVTFTLLDKPAERPYGHSSRNSHYTRQVLPTSNRINAVTPASAGTDPQVGTLDRHQEAPRDSHPPRLPAL